MLALTTGVLAGLTYFVTRASRDELRLERDRLKVSQRPIVIPTDLRIVGGVTMGTIVHLLTIRNAGPGVALNVSTVLTYDSIHNVQPLRHLAAGDEYVYTIEPRAGSAEIAGHIVAYDIAGESWTTSFEAGQRQQGVDHEMHYPLTVTALLPD